jgi:hypothetical protein
MGISQIIASISALVTGLVPLSCQHKAPPPKVLTPPPVSAPAAPAAPTNSILHDLGEVALTNHYERCMQLGGGKECIIYPELQDKKNAKLTVTFESKTAEGRVHDMIVSQIDAKTGESVQLTLGYFQLSLQPDIASE